MDKKKEAGCIPRVILRCYASLGEDILFVVGIIYRFLHLGSTEFISIVELFISTNILSVLD